MAATGQDITLGVGHIIMSCLLFSKCLFNSASIAGSCHPDRCIFHCLRGGSTLQTIKAAANHTSI